VCNWPARAVRRGRPQRREISIAVSTIDVRRLIGIYSAVAGQKAESGRQNHNWLDRSGTGLARGEKSRGPVLFALEPRRSGGVFLEIRHVVPIRFPKSISQGYSPAVAGAVVRFDRGPDLSRGQRFGAGRGVRWGAVGGAARPTAVHPDLAQRGRWGHWPLNVGTLERWWDNELSRCSAP